MITHILNEHQEEGDIRYVCRVCGFHNCDESLMKKHPHKYPSHNRCLKKLTSPEKKAVTASGFIIRNKAGPPKEEDDFWKDLMSVVALTKTLSTKSPSNRRSGRLSSARSIKPPPLKREKTKSSLQSEGHHQGRLCRVPYLLPVDLMWNLGLTSLKPLVAFCSKGVCKGQGNIKEA